MSRVLYNSELASNKEEAETINTSLFAHPQFTNFSKTTECRRVTSDVVENENMDGMDENPPPPTPILPTPNAVVKLGGSNFESVTGVYLSGGDVPAIIENINQDSLSAITVNNNGCDVNDGYMDVTENGNTMRKPISPPIESTFPEISAYFIPSSEKSKDFPNYFINNESITINLGSPQDTGEFDIVAANVAGYGVLSEDIKKFRENIGNDTEEDTNIKIK